jgi:ADP-ribose pyrophosphatase YjhB (NUDIX family)
MDNLHPKQIQLLSNFIFKTEALKHEIDFHDMPDDEAEDHLVALIEGGFMALDDGKYTLTTHGKDIAGRLDFETSKMEKQPKTVMTAVCRKMEDGVEKYLMHIRKEHPYFDFMAFPSGTAKHGQYLAEGVVRELEEETGLTGTPILKEIKHMLIRTRDTGKVMDDVVMYAFEIINIQGELIEKTIEGENCWMSLEEIQKYDKVLQNTWDIIESLSKHGMVFEEEMQEVDSL